MRIIMFGPGHGHNAKAFIDFFEKEKFYEVYYICRGPSNWQSSEKLTVISYKKLFSVYLIKLLFEKPAVVWVHGGYDWLQLLMISCFSHAASFLSLNIWGDQVPKKIVKKNIKGIFYKKVLKRFDQIHCNWYGTFEILKKHFDNLLVQPWGLSSEFFLENSAPPHAFSQKFISQLPPNRYLFFYPKSILPVSGHMEILQACVLLADKDQLKFKVYFWVGNSEDSLLEKKCRDFISNHRLEGCVEIVKHPFLPFADMKKIWQSMNCGLQIAKSDQLSTTFLEPQYLKKEVIATDIFPYKKYAQQFGVSFDFVCLNPKSIAQKMESCIKKCNETSLEVLSLRSQTVEKNFHFDSNISSLLKSMTRKLQAWL